MSSTTDERYTVISADCHAGGSHAAYREYLDPAFRDEFDAWRGKYKNPYKDLGDTRRLRNWDNEMRNGQQEDDGVVAEVVFPNTVPPFFPSFVLFAKPPTAEEYRQRRAGIQAHNRWLKDFCDAFPERRAGVGQIFLNDVDDAMEDVRWIKENGLRGGILLPNVAPDVKWVKPLYDPIYEPLWALCEELDVPVNMHSGSGQPDYGAYPVSMLLYINEVAFYTQRPLVHLLLSGVFERHPQLKFVMTEIGCSWVPDLLGRLDSVLAMIRDTGATGEIRYGAEHVLPRSATDYFRQNVWMGVSNPSDQDVATRHEIGIDRWMWGSDYPHDEGSAPYTKQHLRARFHDVPRDEVEMMLNRNAADLYGFDLDALAPLAAKVGPSVAETALAIEDVPEKELQRLSGDMDMSAIK
jgi:predicted TIM-barrel fold metal-dependent hydrolase